MRPEHDDEAYQAYVEESRAGPSRQFAHFENSPKKKMPTGILFLFLAHSALSTLAHTSHKRRDSNEDVNNLDEPWPLSEDNLYQVPVEESNKSPVNASNPEEPPADITSAAHSFFHKTLVKE